MWDPPSVAFGPAVFGGAVSWCLAANRDLDIAATLNDHVLLDPTGRTGDVLDRVGRVARALGVPLLNASPLARVLFPDCGPPLPEYPTRQALDAVADTLHGCRRDLAAADPGAADGDVVRRELDHAIALSQFAVDLLRARAEADGRADAVGGGPGGGADAIDGPTARRLLRELTPLLAEQRACWLLRSRPGGLEDSLARADRVRHDLLRAAHR
jgi:hexosaminidase